MAKKFDLTTISSGKTAAEVRQKVLSSESSANNSKVSESDSKNLEKNEPLIQSPTEFLSASVESPQAQGVATALPLASVPEISKSANSERPSQNRVQTEYKQSTERGTESKRTEYNESTNGVQNWTYFRLKGNEKKLMDFVFLKCDQIASKISPPLSLETLASIYGEPSLKNKNTAKVCLRRLVTDKKLLKRSGSETGRGGYTQVELSEGLFMTIKAHFQSNNQGINGVQSVDKQSTQQSTQQSTNPPYSSSTSFSEDINNTNIEIPEVLKRMITVGRLRKLIASGVTNLEKVEFSLENFAFDIVHNKRFKSGAEPIAIFYGALKGGDVYNSRARVESESEALRIETDNLKKQLDILQVRKDEQLRTRFKLWFERNSEGYLELLGLTALAGSSITTDENRLFEVWKLKINDGSLKE